MPDSKISNLPSATAVTGRDILLVIKRSGNTTFTDKKIEGDAFFGNIASNTAISGTFTVTGNTTLARTTATILTSQSAITSSLRVNSNGVIISTKFTPGSSSIDDTAYPQGKFSFDENYIYVKVSANTIKRAALNSF